jgi:hypothetical protein
LGEDVVSKPAIAVASACFGVTDADVTNAENAKNVATILAIVVAGVVFSVAIVAAARMVLWKWTSWKWRVPPKKLIPGPDFDC